MRLILIWFQQWRPIGPKVGLCTVHCLTTKLMHIHMQTERLTGPGLWAEILSCCFLQMGEQAPAQDRFHSCFTEDSLNVGVIYFSLSKGQGMVVSHPVKEL